MAAPNYHGWTDDRAGMRWQEMQAVWYAAEQLNASEITDAEAVQLGAALRNAAQLDAAEPVRNSTDEAGEPRIINGVSSPEWYAQKKEVPF